MGEILPFVEEEECKTPTEKYILDGISNFFRYGICSMKGWRQAQEDSFLVKLNIGPNKSTHIFGIFDGHGGREVSKFISNHFVEEFLNNKNYKKGDIKQCLKETFLNLDKKLLEQSSMQEMTEDHYLFMQEFNLQETPINSNAQESIQNKEDKGTQVIMYQSKSIQNTSRRSKPWLDNKKIEIETIIPLIKENVKNYFLSLLLYY